MSLSMYLSSELYRAGKRGGYPNASNNRQRTQRKRLVVAILTFSSILAGTQIAK